MRPAPTIAAMILGMSLTTAGVRAQAPAGLVTLPTPDAHGDVDGGRDDPGQLR